MGEFNQQKYVNQYVKENYEKLIVLVKKGEKEKIKEHWKSKGYKSLNSYINHLIDEDMKEDRTPVQGGEIEYYRKTIQKIIPSASRIGAAIA